MAPASHSHFNQGLWVKNIQQKIQTTFPPLNKNICYAGLSLITEGRMSSGSQWVPTNSGEPELCLLACLRSSSGVFMGGFCKESKKKSYSPPPRNWEVFFQSPAQPCAHPSLLPKGVSLSALNLLRQRKSSPAWARSGVPSQIEVQPLRFKEIKSLG